MAEINESRYQAYWDAVVRHVCASCLDQRSDGQCGLTRNRVCAISSHLPAVVEAILSVQSDRMDEYVTAIESRVCGECDEQDTRGHCATRDRGECALSLYLYLVVDAIQEVHESERARARAGSA